MRGRLVNRGWDYFLGGEGEERIGLARKAVDDPAGADEGEADGVADEAVGPGYEDGADAWGWAERHSGTRTLSINSGR